MHPAKFVLRNRHFLLIILLAATALMGFFATRVQLSYEFSKAIPTSNPKYQDYLSFKSKFGDDGNILVIGMQSPQFFELQNFVALQQLTAALKKVRYVEEVLSVANAVDLLKDTANQKLNALQIFPSNINTQKQIDSSLKIFHSLPFYRSLLYNPGSNAYLVIVRINNEVLNSKGRTAVIDHIVRPTN